MKYFGYRDLVDWDLMGELWDELEAGSIGAEEFPTYELAVRQADSDVWDELWTNYESEGKDIVVRARDADFLAILDVQDPNGDSLGRNTQVAIELQDGDNWLGIMIVGGIPSGDKVKLRWVGFDWIKVIYEAPQKPDLAALDLCDLLPPGGEGVRRSDDYGCSQSYAHSAGFSHVQIYRISGGSARACQQWKEVANNTIIKTLDIGDCAYVGAYTDPESGKVVEGAGASWTVFFAVDDFRVFVTWGTHADSARSTWVFDRVAEVQERLRELAGVDS